MKEFQSYTKEGTDPQRLYTLLPEFYHFVGGCKKQVEKEMELAQEDLKEDEIRAAEGLLNNLSALHTLLLETSRQLGISLETKGHTVTADHRTQEIRINFERCHQDSLKNVVIQAIRDTLDVEAPLANSGYTVEREPDNSISIRVIHYQKS